MEGIKRKHLGEQGWRELVQRFDGAGVTVGEFCLREGVSKSSFQRWRSLLTTTRLPATGERDDRPQERAAPRFVDLGALGGSGGQAGRLEIRLELGGGIALHLVRG